MLLTAVRAEFSSGCGLIKRYPSIYMDTEENLAGESPVMTSQHSNRYSSPLM
jgi:hypothetical protein